MRRPSAGTGMSRFLDDPTFLARMKSGYACLGYTQFLPGYCLLFADPQVPGLNDLDMPGRTAFLTDMSLLGDAIMVVCQPVRINYGILANSSPVLHAHLYRRYEWEPEKRRSRNVWTYPDECWTDEAHRFSEDRHGAMKQRLADALVGLMDTAYGT